MVPSTAIHSSPAGKRSYVHHLDICWRCSSNFSLSDLEVRISRILAPNTELRQLPRTHPVLIFFDHSSHYIVFCQIAKKAPKPLDALEMPGVRDWGGEARPTALYISYTNSNQYAAQCVFPLGVFLQEGLVCGVL